MKLLTSSPGIIVGGKSYALVSARVVTWNDHGLQFKPGMGANKARTLALSMAVLHWTGAENEPDTVFATLVKRGLGIEFAIGGDGTVWQFADPLLCDTADAGRVNGWSWGVEIVCSGLAPNKLTSPATWLRGRDRERYTARIHGADRKLVDFRPAQYTALLELADAMSSAVPTVARRVCADGGAVFCDLLVPSALRRWSGYLCHSNVSVEKLDAGPRVLGALQAHFAQGLSDTLPGAVA